MPANCRPYAVALAAAWLMLASPSASAQDAPATETETKPSDVTLSIATWGGAYGQSQEIAYFEPFTQKTGVKIKTETYDGTLAAIKDKIGSSSSPFDIVDLSQGALDALCRDGLLEQIDSSALTSGPGGQSVSDDFLSGGITSLRHRQRRLVDGNRLRPPGLHQGTAREDRRPPRHPALPGKAGAAQWPALHARACAARRRRRSRRHLHPARDAGGRRPRLQGARQDQGADPVVGQGGRLHLHADAAQGVDGGRL